MPDAAVPPEVSILLAKLTPPQQALVDVVCETFVREDYRWPIYQYVEWRLEREGHEMRQVVASLPVLGAPPQTYGVLGATTPLLSAHDGVEVPASALGFSHWAVRSGSGPQIATEVLRTIGYFAAERELWQPLAFEVTQLEVLSDDVLQYLHMSRRGSFPHGQWLSKPEFGRALLKILPQEPGVGGGFATLAEDLTRWNWFVNGSIRHYAGLASMADYLTRMAATLAVPRSHPAKVLASPLDLPGSLSYLDTGWRLLHEGRHLIALNSPERAATLSYDVASREEFFDRISALFDVMKHFNVPKGGDQTGGFAIAKLRAYLAWKLPGRVPIQNRRRFE